MDPPFIQLSQTQSHISISSSSTSETESQSSAPSSAPSTSPSPGLSTHNTKRANYHVKDISEFARTLEISANRAFPNRGLTRYKRVEVLLLRWEEDELQVEWELNDLAKVFREYNFNTETWLIPTESPYMNMMAKALQFVGGYQSEDTLLIVYYGGHAKINEARQSTWSCTRNLAHSSFEWNGCQALFEQSKSDTLLLLDCCAAAAAAATVPCRTNSITEIIAACGWETWAPEPGRHSFTNTLIEVLEDWIDRKCFSAAMLHCEVLSILKQPRPRRNREISKTPVYIVSTSNPKTCSIELGRRPALTSLVGETTQATDSTSSQCQPQVPSSMKTDAAASQDDILHPIAENDHKFDLSSLLATLPDKTFVHPHVIMSVALEEDQLLDLDRFQNWMRTFPALAKYAKIEGVYHSHSTLVLVSVPVIVWNMLPENPAYNFVGYARSTNLMEPSAPIQILNETSTSWAQDDVSSHGSWDSLETMVPGKTSILKSGLFAKYFALEGEIAHSAPPTPPKRPSSQKYGLSEEGKHAKKDQYGPLGLVTLFDPSKPAVADLVFVHGLGGGSQKTWMKGNNPSSYWPQQWLPKDGSFQNVRIHSFGYSSNWTKENTLTINDFAKALLVSIQDSPRIPRGSHTPLLFVCHSMGGLVVKQAYILAQQNAELLPLVRRIKAILFLATPHGGSDPAQMLNKMIGLTSGRKPYISDLIRHSRTIQATNEEFRQYCQNIQLYSFYETLPTSSGLIKSIIVDKDRAVLGYPNERSTLLNADHRGVCQFEEVSDPNYRTIRNALASAIADLHAHDTRLREEIKEDQQRRLDLVLGVTQAVEDDLIEIESLCIQGSCQWLIEKPSFQEWKESPASTQIYWMSARPATGKTVLSGKVVTHLKSLGLDCSFYFFKNGNKSEKSAISSFLLSMAWQMGRANPDVLSTILNICEEYNQLSNVHYQIVWRRLFLEGIWQTRSQKPRYWVIDALDECLSGDELFRMLLQISVDANLRIFLTSRKKIESHGIPAPPNLKIISEEILVEDTRSDIRLYLHANLDQLPAPDEQTRQELIALILEKSDGSFLWVSLVLRELSMVHSISEAREVLAAVPTGMDVLYSRILDSLSQFHRGKELIKSILRWTVCSIRPLKTDELYHALRFDLNDNIDSIKRVISMCGQLVFIDSQSRVRIVHQTARQFLLRPGINSEFAIDKDFAHTRILIACMNYLSSDEMRRPSARKSSSSKGPRVLCSFAEYACTMFFQHLNCASSTDDQIVIILAKFLSSSNVLMWIEYVAAQQSGLNMLVEAAKVLKQYTQRRSKHQSLFGKDISRIAAWSTDLVHLVTKFGTHLLASPSSIFTLIPPLCPPDSALAKHASSTRGISLSGLSATTWDDCLSTVIDPQDQYVALAVSKTEFAIGMASGKIAIYYQATCEQLRTLKHQEVVRVLKFGHVRGTLASAGARLVHVWDVTSGAQLWGFNIPDQCLSLEFADQDQLLLGALGDNCYVIWDMATGVVTDIVGWTEDLSTRAYASRRPISAKFCLESSLLAVVYRGEDIVLWDLENDSIHEICSRGRGAQIICVVFSNVNDKYFAASYEDGDLVLFDMSECQIVQRTLANAQVLACSPDGRTLAGGDSSGIISIFDFEELTLLYRIHTESSIQQLEFSGDGGYLLNLSGGQCRIWDPPVFLRSDVSAKDRASEAGLSAPPLEVESEQPDSRTMITSITSHGNDRDIFVGKGDGSVHLYEAKSGQQIQRLLNHGPYSSVISLHFDNKSETLISLDDSNHVMIHHCTDLGSPSKELKPLFDQQAPGTIHQVLGNIEHTQLLVSLSLKDTLWTISSNGSLVTKTIEWENRESFRWASHPSQPDKLILIIGNVLHLYEWSTLNRLTGPHGILLELSRPSGVDIRSITPCFGQNYFATLFSDVTTPHCNLRGFLWNTSDFSLRCGSQQDFSPAGNKLSTQQVQAKGKQLLHSARIFSGKAGKAGKDFLPKSKNLEDSTFAVQTPPYSILDVQVRHIIGYCGQRLVYLNQDGWICSVDLHIKVTTRHFFLPTDWFSTNRELIIELTAKGDVLFAKRDELAVIRRGLDSSFETDPE